METQKRPGGPRAPFSRSAVKWVGLSLPAADELAGHPTKKSEEVGRHLGRLAGSEQATRLRTRENPTQRRSVRLAAGGVKRPRHFGRVLGLDRGNSTYEDSERGGSPPILRPV